MIDPISSPAFAADLRQYGDLLISLAIAIAGASADGFARRAWRFVSPSMRSLSTSTNDNKFLTKRDVEGAFAFLLIVNTWFAMLIQWFSCLWKLYVSSVPVMTIMSFILYGIVVACSFGILMSYDSKSIRRKTRFKLWYYKYFPLVNFLVVGVVTHASFAWAK